MKKILYFMLCRFTAVFLSGCQGGEFMQVCADMGIVQESPDKVKKDQECPHGYSTSYFTLAKGAFKDNPKEARKAIFSGLTIMANPTSLPALRELGKLMKEDLSH